MHQVISDVQHRRATPLNDDDTEIVIVSDTVRQRRSRTPITPSSDSNRESNLVMMPDLLSNGKRENGTESVSVVSNHTETQIRDNGKHVGKIVDTVSILENCNKLELQHVETVNIVDVTSDSDTATSTPLMPRKSPHNSIDELKTELERELDTLANALKKPKISLQHYENDRDILKDSEEFDENVLKMKLRPSFKELLTEEKESIKSGDKDNFESNDDEPLEFSDDEEIPRYSIEMDSDSDLVDRNLDKRGEGFAI